RAGLQLPQDFLPQVRVLRQKLPGSGPPSSPGFGKGLRISSHHRVEEGIVLGEDDRSRMGPMLEELLLVPQESIQVRHPKIADPAPEGEDMRRGDDTDWVPVDKAQDT